MAGFFIVVFTLFVKKMCLLPLENIFCITIWWLSENFKE